MKQCNHSSIFTNIVSNKNKLQRFADIGTFPNVYQNTSYIQPQLINHEGKLIDLKGQWHQHFGNSNPIVLELACGKGDYARALAKENPHLNFIGVDIKGNRLWVGAKEALEQGLTNVAFLRTEIYYLDNFFAPDEVQQIWITFADPQLGNPKKRLTSPRFLTLYKKLLAPDHLLHLKTDSPELYESTLEVLQELQLPILYQRDDIYAQPLDFPELQHKTFYEQMHLENKKTIKYVRWKLS